MCQSNNIKFYFVFCIPPHQPLRYCKTLDFHLVGSEWGRRNWWVVWYISSLSILVFAFVLVLVFVFVFVFVFLVSSKWGWWNWWVVWNISLLSVMALRFHLACHKEISWNFLNWKFVPPWDVNLNIVRETKTKQPPSLRSCLIPENILASYHIITSACSIETSVKETLRMTVCNK